ncbi:MAG: hypothetical protein ABJB49_03220 [Nitrospirota bacterium]
MIYGAKNQDHIKKESSRHACQKSGKSETQNRSRGSGRRRTKSGQEDLSTARADENATKKTPVSKQGALQVDAFGHWI